MTGATVRRIERWFGRALLALALALCATARAEQAARLEVANPRPFGHVIGDVLERRITVEVDSRYALERAHLPGAGRLDAWLDARAPAVAAFNRLGRTRYEITLTYQIIGSPETVTTLALPEVPLTFAPAEAALAETIPEWPITVAPLTPTHVLGRAGLDEMRPDRAPVAIATRPLELRLGLYVSAAALLLLYLGYLRYGLPWAGRPGPFARAYQDLKSLRGEDPHARRAALKRLHRAFEETAGRAVFAGDLTHFFASHPRFTGARAAIENVFETSRQEFFGDAQPVGATLPELLAFCRECRRHERGGR